MATIRKEVIIDAPPDQVWDAMRDYGAVHQRVVPGFVVDAQIDGQDRVVTFGNGMVARETLITLDDHTRRLAYSASGGRLTHHNASNQIFDDGHGRARFVWIADVLPDEVAAVIDGMMEEGARVAKQTLECAVAAAVAGS